VPAVVREWAVYAGNTTDSSFKIPVIIEDGDAIVATFSLDSVSGPDIKIIRYGGESIEGEVKWETTWTGSGNGRDVPTGLFVFEHEIYVCGISWSSTGNYDFVTIKLDDQGGIIWTETYNGSASNYDVASAIAVSSTGVFVTGAANQTGTSLDFTTICYDKSNGSQLWIAHHDYQSLMDIPFSLQLEGSNVIVVGACQETLQAWEYQGIIYEDNGNYYDSYNSSGSSSGFDRALAVCADSSGNVYITGAISTANEGFNIKTVKIEPGGHVAWEVEHDQSGGDDTGFDVMVDEDQNVYVCGSVSNHVNGSSDDFYLIKYTVNGQKDWDVLIDRENDVDIARALCMDSYGNIIVTGESYREDEQNMIFRPDFLTVGFTQAGEEIWRDYFGAVDKNDQATDIAADLNGNVYVTGNIGEDQDIQTVTIRYRTDYYTEPVTTEPASANFAYYENTGQLIDTEGGSPDYVHYYMPNHSPMLFFQKTNINLVWASGSQDTTTQDSLFRVDMFFDQSEYNEKPAMLTENDSGNYINYYLGHCPEGITAYANEKLLYSGIYPGIDLIFSSNAAGMKMYFICEPGSDPSNIGLSFTGQDSLSIVNNWSLRLETLLGNYDFERPRVYQQDQNGNVSTLPWQLNWSIEDDSIGRFSNWGAYDTELKLVIEVKRTLNNGNWPHLWNLEWSTLDGGSEDETFWDIESDDTGNIYVAGSNYGGNFPVYLAFQSTNAGGFDAVLVKFNISCERLFATYIGGRDPLGSFPFHRPDDYGTAVLPDNHGYVYLAGSSATMDFPVYQMHNGLHLFDDDNSIDTAYGATSGDIFIAKFTDSGSRVWASYFGQDASDNVWDMDMDANHNIYFVGNSHFMYMDNPPAYFNDQASGTIFRLNSNDTVDWVSGIGTNVNAIDIDHRNYKCITGYVNPFSQAGINTIPLNNAFDSTYNGSSIDYDAFITLFNESNEIVWSTYFGGTQFEAGNGVAFDNNHNIIAVGYSESFNLDTYKDPAFQNSHYDTSQGGGSPYGDGFIVKYDSSGQRLHSTYFGDSLADLLNDVNVDHDGKIFIVGTSASLFLPVSNTGRFYEQQNAGGEKVILAQFDNGLNLEWFTYLGLAVNPFSVKSVIDQSRKKLYITGGTTASLSSAAFPYVEFDNLLMSDHFENDIQNNTYRNGFLHRFDLDWNLWTSLPEIELSNDELIVFPNPVQKILNIRINAKKTGRALLQIYNSSGAIVRNQNIDVEGGVMEFSLDLESCSPGLYMVVLNSTEMAVSSKFILSNK